MGLANRVCAALAVVASIGLSHAQAPSPEGMQPFSLPGIDYQFPLPDGYCLPTGRYETQAKLAAAADRANLTDISYYVCADMQADAAASSWGMLKTPLKLLNSGGTTRQQMIDYLKTQIDPDALKKIFADAAKVANEGVHDTIGADTNVTFDLKPLDADDNAAYMGGTVTVNDAGGQRYVACAYSTTVVKDRVFLLYFFQPYQDARDITALLAKVKTATADFIAANGG